MEEKGAATIAGRGTREPDHVDAGAYGVDPTTGVFRHPDGAPYFTGPRPVSGSLPEPEDRQYIDGMTIEGHWPELVVNTVTFQNIVDMSGRRYLYHYYRDKVNVYDITEPRNLKILLQRTSSDPAETFGAAAIAYNERLGKWIMIQAFEVPRGGPNGMNGKKYTDPAAARKIIDFPGFRGIKIFELKSPVEWVLLSTMSTDVLNPSARPAQGSGALDSPVYYGGKYAFVAAAPDNTFINQEYPNYLYSAAQMVIDVDDPTDPKIVSTWWVPGQRLGEDDAHRAWREFDNRTSWTGARMPVVLDKPIDQGGRFAYTAMGALGLYVLDVSDPRKIRQVGKLDLPAGVGGVEGDNIDASRAADFGIVLTNGYPMNEDGYEPYKDVYIVDVKDPAAPRILGTLPRPRPPASAPYSDFVLRRGKFGPKRSHYYWQPGQVDPNIVVFPFNNAGIQVFDIRDRANAKIVAYFVPRMTDAEGSKKFSSTPMECTAVEWDRKLIWGFSNSGLYLLSCPSIGEPSFDANRIT
jgi:hypothetical protein